MTWRGPQRCHHRSQPPPRDPPGPPQQHGGRGRTRVAGAAGAEEPRPTRALKRGRESSGRARGELRSAAFCPLLPAAVAVVTPGGGVTAVAPMPRPPAPCPSRRPQQQQRRTPSGPGGARPRRSERNRRPPPECWVPENRAEPGGMREKRGSTGGRPGCGSLRMRAGMRLFWGGGGLWGCRYRSEHPPGTGTAPSLRTGTAGVAPHVGRGRFCCVVPPSSPGSSGPPLVRGGRASCGGVCGSLRVAGDFVVLPPPRVAPSLPGIVLAATSVCHPPCHTPPTTQEGVFGTSPPLPGLCPPRSLPRPAEGGAAARSLCVVVPTLSLGSPPPRGAGPGDSP